jgi:signal transduction histidine kinase/DNA-binding response OmpR family regulator
MNSIFPGKVSRITLFLLSAAFIWQISGCRPATEKKIYTIGFSQCTQVDQWRLTMLEELKRELSFHNNATLITSNADGNSEKQITQIRQLVQSGIDLLIVSPNEVKPLSPVIREVYESGIPVVVVDRRTDTKQYTSFVGASNYEVGQNAGRYAATILKGQGNLMEVTGMPDASPVIDRHNGFLDLIKIYPGLNYVKEFVNFRSVDKPLLSEIENYLGNHKIDLIYAQNDFMAYEMYRVCKKLGLQNDIKIIGIDGLPNKGLGLDMVANKYISATILYPTGGQEAMLTAFNILEGKPYKKENQLFTTVIDSSNVRIMKLQNERVLAQQADIDRRQRKIEEQAAISRNQANAIYAISFLLALAIILGAITYYYLRENRKINRQLENQNGEILSQQSQLIEMSAKAKDATEAKFNFFTNISHEFRTPLTLIMAPLEELMANNRLQPGTRLHIHMIQRNVIRLLRMVNQLIDFRKVELNKMEVKASQNDLVQFTRDVMDAFYDTAFKRGIDLKFFTTESKLPAWFDVNMLDKVLFNMLSNAIKFTKDDGLVQVFIERSKDGKLAFVSVKDNGIGMNDDQVAHAFDLFYQAGFETYRGSGIGLSLSKELVELHHGKISIESALKKGTIIRVELPLGNSHFQPSEILQSSELETHLLKENAGIYTGDLAPISNQDEDDIQREPSHEFTILLAEDNGDLLKFMSMRLAKNYDIITAENGQDALNKAFEELPDLVISDVMMPGKSGFELTKILKTDVRTAHIPVILLTAKTAVNHQVEGYNKLADAFISKPFNVEVLENNINSILANRRRMKEHFTANNKLDAKLQHLKKNDRRFVNDFCAFVEANLANEGLRVEDICSHMSLSRVQLYRKVKTLLDCNVNEYILNTRLQKAKYFLQHEDLSVAEISYKVGFASPSYFSTVFKGKYDMSPREFREDKAGV